MSVQSRLFTNAKHRQVRLEFVLLDRRKCQLSIDGWHGWFDKHATIAYR
jgi:hypothetical protein